MNSIGINYPLKHTNRGGYFGKTFQDIAQIKANLVNLLSTRRGERIMNPNFGTVLYKFTHRSKSEETLNLVESEIEEAVSRFMPYLEIIELETKIDRRDQIAVFIEFGSPELPGQQDQISVTLGSE